MPALDAHRIFLSTVTAEFAHYRTELAARFDRVSVKAVFQEEFEYHDTDLVEKLYRLIVPCDVVIHFVGAAAGAVANPKAVEDFLRRCQRRGEDFLGFWKKEHGLDRAFFDQLTYTQWEAVIAWFLKKSLMPLQPRGRASDGHPPGKPPFTPVAEDTASQTRHLAWLGKTIRRYPQALTETGGSYLEDAFDKITGFLLRENAQWRQTAQQLQALPSAASPSRTAFISHTSADDGYVAELEPFLRASGFWEVFNDVSSIKPDERFWPEIEKGIRGCEVFYCVIGEKTKDSAWVRREVELARSLSKAIVPMWIEGDAVPNFFEGRDVVDFRLRRRREDATKEKLIADAAAEMPLEQLLDLLGDLNRSMFAEVLFHFDPKNQIPGGEVSQRERAMELIKLMRAKDGGLPKLVLFVAKLRSA